MLVLKSTYNELLRELESVEEDLEDEAKTRAKFARENLRLKGALIEILQQQTKAPNATVTRILKIAEEALRS